MELNLDGKYAIVLGASKGLGFACADLLGREGANVTIVSRSAPSLNEAADRLEASCGRRPSVVAGDVADAPARNDILSAVEAPDILITNAGGPPGMDYKDVTLAHWKAALETNFLSSVEMIRNVLPGMCDRQFGRIVNITSLTVRMPVGNLDLSTAPRLALTGYTAGVARQVADQGVTINNLLPGTIMTERLKDLGATAEGLINKVPMGRAGTPEEFASMGVFLCSKQAGYVTGQNILVDGGLCPFTV